MKPNILLIGGGGHCKAVIDVIEQTDLYSIAGIIDQKERIGEEVLGYKIIGSDDDLEHLRLHSPNAIVTVGQIHSTDVRIKLFSLLTQLGYHLPTIISPHAYVSRHATIGKGTIVMHDALINADVSIAENCIINTKSLIEHDCRLEAHCHLSTGAILNGSSKVGTGTFIGSNAVTKEGTHIAPHSFIKAGSIVV